MGFPIVFHMEKQVCAEGLRQSFSELGQGRLCPGCRDHGASPSALCSGQTLTPCAWFGAQPGSPTHTQRRRGHTRVRTHPRTPPAARCPSESLFLVITVQTTHSPGCAETLRTNPAMCRAAKQRREGLRRWTSVIF